MFDCDIRSSAWKEFGHCRSRAHAAKSHVFHNVSVRLRLAHLVDRAFCEGRGPEFDHLWRHAGFNVLGQRLISLL